MSTQPQPFLSQEQYLEIERKADRKSEYFAGQMFAMAGSSREHVRISVNCLIALSSRSKGSEIYSSDMRVLTGVSGLYTYPDVSVACDSPKFEDAHLDTLLNPVLIIEVLSPSTEAYDRGKKFELYRGIVSLRHYLLIAQDRYHVDHFLRQPDDTWLLHSLSGLDDVVHLDDFTLPLGEVYAGLTPPS